jgi:hypothetical protein
MIKHIRNLSKKELAKESYKKIISLINHFVYKYNWPKSILDETNRKNHEWHHDDIVSFTHQFILFIFEKNKLRNIDKIPDEYIDYYFHQILVTYVSDKIQQSQRIDGVSFETVKRIVKDLLVNNYTEVEIKSKRYWSQEDKYDKKVLSHDRISNLVDHLPKIPISTKTKHYKQLVKRGVDNIFSVTESLIEENNLFKLTYSLFDQSYFTEPLKDEIDTHNIDNEKLSNIINQIGKEVEIDDIPLIIKYYFKNSKSSLGDLAIEFGIPKSTLHYKINRFKNLLNRYFIPQNDVEGIYFLEKLYEKLDEIK